MPRILTPEILDDLPADDPAAIRSRADLRRINAVMGNYRWIAREMRKQAGRVTDWIELGAGDGGLARHANVPALTGVDFAPRPASWPAEWDWKQGDLFESLPGIIERSDSVGIVANLFLHHLTDEQLGHLGEMLGEKTSVLITSEPARHAIHQIQGMMAYPLVNYVTRHDMRVSIEAGFRDVELSQTMKLDSNFESIETSHHFWGAYRVVASQTKHD